MDAQIEKDIAEINRKFCKEDQYELDDALRELAQRVLEVAAQRVDLAFINGADSQFGEVVRSVADGPQKGKTT